MESNKSLKKPVIILVGTQLSHNIGATARAMLNFDCQELRLVNPVLKDKWYDKHAISMAAGATKVLDNVKVYNSTEQAVSDLNFIIATSRRRRDMVKPIVHPDIGCAQIHKQSALGNNCGILFGCEKSGLDNHDISLSDMVIEVPVNPDFASLNLSQAVLLVVYQWSIIANHDYKIADEKGESSQKAGDIILNIPTNTQNATKKQKEDFFGYLIGQLEQNDFFTAEDRTNTTIIKLRNLFNRFAMTEREVKILWSVIRSLQK